VLHGAFLPSSPALYFQGTSSLGAGIAFGDGLRCVGGTITRLGVHASVGGASLHPVGGSASISVAGGVTTAGTTRHYQVLYRNNAAFCTSAAFNLTNAVRVVWGS
jgi:hypothetical protein